MFPLQQPQTARRNRRLQDQHTLVITAWNGGFFSHVNRVVNHLHHSLGHKGCAAVRVDWHVGEHIPLFIYGTKADGELWRHFFEPLAFPNAPDDELTTWQYADLSMTGLHAYRMYKRGSRWRVEYGRAFAEHVHVHVDLRRHVNDLRQDNGVGARSIGVHYRHPDHGHECPRPIPPIDLFIARTRSLLRGDTLASVVLATDVHEAVDSFRAAFGDRLLVQPGVGRVHAREQQHSQVMPPSIALGQQALIDALLLARCDVLLHTVSNLATAVGYMNPQLRMVYCEPPLIGASATVRARLSPARRATLKGVSRRPPEIFS
jgi:hypothetical protein